MGRPVDADGNELFIEYPKALADGTVVQNAEEETAWTAGPSLPAEPVAPEGEDAAFDAPSPLDDVTIEMDDPTFDAPKKKATKKK